MIENKYILDITPEEYRQLEGINQSSLKDYDSKGVKCFIEKEEVENEWFNFGSLVEDTLMFPDIIEDKYYWKELISPDSTHLKVLADFIKNNNLYEKAIKNNTNIISYIEELGLFKSIKATKNSSRESKLEELFDNDIFWNYLTGLKEAEGKTIVSIQDRMDSILLTKMLQEHEYTKDIFNHPKVEYQVAVQYNFELNEEIIVPLKALFDILIIDDKDKTISVKDLKTTSNLLKNFEYEFFKYKYYIQAVIYQELAKEIFSELIEQGYTLLPFEFIVVNREYSWPLRFVISNTRHKIFYLGFGELAEFFTMNGYEYTTVSKLLADYIWQLGNTKDVEREIFENKGVMEL